MQNQINFANIWMLSFINQGAISIKSVTPLKRKLLHWYINYAIILTMLPSIFIWNSLQIQSLWCTCSIMFLAIYLLTFREKDCNITIEIQLRINQNYSERRNIILFVQQWIIFSFVDHVKARFLKRSWIIYTHKYVSTKNVKITEELLFMLQKLLVIFTAF